MYLYFHLIFLSRLFLKSWSQKTVFKVSLRSMKLTLVSLLAVSLEESFWCLSSSIFFLTWFYWFQLEGTHLKISLANRDLIRKIGNLCLVYNLNFVYASIKRNKFYIFTQPFMYFLEVFLKKTQDVYIWRFFRRFFGHLDQNSKRQNNHTFFILALEPPEAKVVETFICC